MRLPLLAPRSARPLRVLARGMVALALGAAACGDSSPAVDATTASSAESAEISIRFDVSGGKATSVEALAFRATSTSTSSTPPEGRPDVLGIVDPLAAESPDQGCALRDIDLATKALALRGGSIDLQELTGIGIGMGGVGTTGLGDSLLRPFPRLYPDVATVVGGVVAEAGPQYLGALPERITLFTAESELPVLELAVPSAPRAIAVNGAALVPGLRVDAPDGLSVTVAGSAGGRIELRPFGATIAATCSIPANASPEGIVNVPRSFIAQLVRATGAAPGAPLAVSLEVVRRTRLLAGLSGVAARVSVEVRSAATVELRP